MFQDPNVLVGFETGDDAGVYLLDEGHVLVQTVDFFTPVVDDPYVYGQIAAANSLSDVYAMGGTPRFALSIVGFPHEKVEEEVLHEILRGGADKMREARAAIIGGHSIQDPEIKFGYCVTGVVERERLYTNSGARSGDRLILTKPLGTGIITTGIKFGKSPAAAVDEAVRWMLQLSAPVKDLMHEHEVHAVTDITGFGLLGHAYEMARASSVSLTLDAGRVPVLKGTEELADQGMLPGGIESNRRFVQDAVSWKGASTLQRQILLDPQTSGGLLISLPERAAEALAADLEAAGLMGKPIGHVSEKGENWIEVRA